MKNILLIFILIAFSFNYLSHADALSQEQLKQFQTEREKRIQNINWEGVEIGLFELGEEQPFLSTKDIAKLDASYDHNLRGLMITMTFNDQAREKLEKITDENIGKQIAVMINGKTVMVAEIRETITRGEIQVAGLSDEETLNLINAYYDKLSDLMQQIKSDLGINSRDMQLEWP